MSIKTDLKMNNISQIFAIGDIHGCKGLLEKIHNKILKKSEKVEGNKILIYLGDYVDRGYKVKETIDTIISFKPRILNAFLLGATTNKCSWTLLTANLKV